MLKKLWIFLTTVDSGGGRNLLKGIVWIFIFVYGMHYSSKLLSLGINIIKLIINR